MSAQNYVGSKYLDARSLPEITNAIRADLKAAKERPDSNPWALPKGIKLSVRREWGNLGTGSIQVFVTAFPGPVLNIASVLMREALPKEACPFPEYTKEVARVLAVLQALMDAYNFDKGDAQTDYFNVNFYGSASLRGDLHTECFTKLLASPEVTTLLPDVQIAVAGGEIERARASIATMNTGYENRETEKSELAALLFPQGGGP